MIKKYLATVPLVLAAMLVSAADKRPNIVIILSDDAGYTDLGSFGGEIDTPNLDELANKGLRLSNFYSNGRCSPTRASLLTGMESAKVGFGGGSLGDWSREMPYPAHRGRLPYETPLLPELLKEQGYHTMMAGKWHLGGSTMKFSKALQRKWKKFHRGWELSEKEIKADFKALPSQRGFNEYFGLYGAQHDFFVVEGGSHSIMRGNEAAKLDYKKSYTLHCYTKTSGKVCGSHHGKTRKAWYDTDGVTDEAIRMIEGAGGKAKAPFMLYIAYRAPHKPLQAPEELVKKYLPRYQDLQALQLNRVKGLKEQKLFPKNAGFRETWVPPEQDDFRRQLAIHSAMMDSIDQNIGRVIEALEKSGELENTFIVYFSDNGSASHLQGYMNVPYHGSKALLWEGGTKTHAIVMWPGKIKPGMILNDLVWVGDLMPSLLEIAGVEYPIEFRGKKTEKMDGRNILPLLIGRSMDPPEFLFFNDKGQQSVIYQGRWKLLIEPGWYLQTREEPGIAYELYDLLEDPAETINLADKKKELVKKLAKMCEKWKKRSGIVDYEEIIKIRPRDPF